MISSYIAVQHTEGVLALAWISTDISYGIFLADHKVLDVVESELVILPAIMCQNLGRAAHLHLRGCLRVSVTRDEIEVIQSVWDNIFAPRVRLMKWIDISGILCGSSQGRNKIEFGGSERSCEHGFSSTTNLPMQLYNSDREVSGDTHSPSTMRSQAFHEFPADSKAVLAMISRIRKATGAPSVSCGVLHQGKVVFTHGEGFANVEEKTVPDEHTIYSVASNTKAFITALCGILVDEGVLSWTDPISKYLPEFKTVHDPEVGKRATLFDLCSHGSGLAPLDCAGTGLFDEFWNNGSAGVQKASNLPLVYDFRAHFLCNNFLLDVVRSVISKVCGKRSGLVMQERIFKPLQMERSFTRNGEYSGDKIMHEVILYWKTIRCC
ncbi:hypothetical protein AJ80_05174 [Polytolypa hystricis UAMH7299]|uniref:Beta-lactamase-related domain-containing protein n=1 Tax=Polytolypa hystricis (strain UAMH7299) TaxID=1447883 RepID=A0A2B7Y5W6_POLH7|nr:hypothetical protein AJ80_05174 [Polytolypa hystricis UAMH7299]